MEATKAVILARVSSKEQEDGHSIDAQKHRLLDYCARKNLEVLQVFEIIESSTRGDRTRFMDMIAYAKRHKECVAIVADKVDRVQRSFKEFPLLDDLIQRGSIELHFFSENTVIHKDSRSSDRTMWSMRVLLAQSYTDSMSENIKRSLEHKRKIGEWAGPAPLGYLNMRDEFGKSIITVDPVRGPIIRTIFEEYATGAHTLEDMTRRARQLGLRSKKGFYLTKAVLHRMVQQPFYYGEMIVKGELVPHRHQALIPHWLYKACEEVRLSYNKKPFKYGGKEYVFRGLLTCATSGLVVTADTKTKKLKDGTAAEYTYLRCHNPEQPSKRMWVREELAIEQVEKVINNLGFKNQEFLDTTISYLKETAKIKKQHHTIEVKELKKEHTEIQRKLDRIMDLRLEGEVTKEEFEMKKRNLKDRQFELLDLIKTYDKADGEFTKRMEMILNLTQRAPEIWKSSTIEGKRELINFLFANLKLKGAKLEFSLRKPFNSLVKIDKTEKWRKR
jgi:site-specific DNA recombinase